MVDHDHLRGLAQVDRSCAVLPRATSAAIPTTNSPVGKMPSEKIEGTAGHALIRLQPTGIAYVTFAVEKPERFRLMNRPELRQGVNESGREQEPVEEAAQSSFAVLLDGIRACQDEGLIGRGDPQPYTFTAWSLVHGLAVMCIDGLIQEKVPSKQETTELERAVTGILGQGLLRR